MDKFIFDEAPLAVASPPQVVLSEQVFNLYRQLAKVQDATAREVGAARQEADASQRQLRRRLADLGAEVFHLRRCVATLSEPLQAAGLSKELNRLDLLVKRFDQALQHAGIEVLSLDGRELDDELTEVVETTGYITADVGAACVHETLDPLVKVDGQVLRFAKIISAVPVTDHD